MKSRFYAILTLLVLLLAVSCGRNKGMFILHGTVPDRADTIVVVGLDSRFENVDTIFSHDGHFSWAFRPDTVTTLILVLPDGRCYPVFAEKDVESTVVIPSDSGSFILSGGYCNEAYQSFRMSALNDTAMEQTYARIDSFITHDPFSEVTPYLIYSEMLQRYHADETVITRLIERMSGNMQDAPYLTSLKTEFKGKPASNVYLNSVTLKDSAGVAVQLSDIGMSSELVLVCVWASWAGADGIEARKSLDSLRVKYSGRKLVITDISVDVNAENWRNAIRKDTLEWKSYIDTKGWESRIIKSCNINRMPAYVLLSGTKRIMLVTRSFREMDSRLNMELPQPEKPQSKTLKKK